MPRCCLSGAQQFWPINLILRGLTGTDEAEIRACVQAIKATHAGTGYLHESFHKDEPTKYIRAWFAWVNILCGEFLWKVYQERPQALG